MAALVIMAEKQKQPKHLSTDTWTHKSRPYPYHEIGHHYKEGQSTETPAVGWMNLENITPRGHTQEAPHGTTALL